MTASIERRSNPRSQSSALVLFRPAQTALARVEGPSGIYQSLEREVPRLLTSSLPGPWRSLLANFSADSLYFLTESFSLRKHMQLVVSLQNGFDRAALHREFVVEVVRQEALVRGRCGVAARLLENTQLRLRDGLIVPETGFWSRWPLVTPTRLNVYA